MVAEDGVDGEPFGEWFKEAAREVGGAGPAAAEVSEITGHGQEVDVCVAEQVLSFAGGAGPAVEVEVGDVGDAQLGEIGRAAVELHEAFMKKNVR